MPQSSANHATSLFRVDKFIVPTEARDAFMEKVEATHAILRRQPGFVRDMLLEQTGGPGRFNIMTLVEWTDAAAVEGAKVAVQAMHALMDFNPPVFMATLGIEADLGQYRLIG